MKKLILLVAVLFCYAGRGHAQNIIRNYDFEDRDAEGSIIGWKPGKGNKNYSLSIDTTVAQSGRSSYLIKVTDTVAAKTAAGATTIIYAPNIAAKRMVSVYAYIKTEDLKGGGALIWMKQFNGANTELAQINSAAQSVAGTSDWKMHSIEFKINPEVKSIQLGFFMQGTGKVWFDNFRVTFDDVPVGSSLTLK